MTRLFLDSVRSAADPHTSLFSDLKKKIIRFMWYAFGKPIHELLVYLTTVSMIRQGNYAKIFFIKHHGELWWECIWMKYLTKICNSINHVHVFLVWAKQRSYILCRLGFCPIKHWQWITQHAMQYKPIGPASIPPHCGLTTGFHWHGLNKSTAASRKATQFKTCFTHVPLSASLYTCRLPPSPTHMYTNQI